MVAGVCLLSASSVTQHICNVTNQAAARGGQSCYVPLRRHLVLANLLIDLVVLCALFVSMLQQHHEVDNTA